MVNAYVLPSQSTASKFTLLANRADMIDACPASLAA